MVRASKSDVDLDLFRRASTGDAAAFVKLHRRFHRAMGAVAACHVGDPAAAEEVVQDAWEAVLRGFERFEGRSSVSTWIFAIVANKARTRGVREKRSVPLSALDDEGGDTPSLDRFAASGRWITPPAPWTRSPADVVSDAQLVARIQAGLEALPPAQRAVVVLRDIEGEDAQTVCNVLGLTETNQRVLLHRGRTRLREHLDALEREPR